MRRRYEILILLFLLLPASIFSLTNELYFLGSNTIGNFFGESGGEMLLSIVLMNPLFLVAYFAWLLTKVRLVVLIIIEVLCYSFAFWVFAFGIASGGAKPSITGFSILIGIFPVAITVLCGYVLKSYGTSQEESPLQHRNQADNISGGQLILWQES